MAGAIRSAFAPLAVHLVEAIYNSYISARFQGSAFKTLGIAIGDVGACLFTLWLCVDWIFNLNVRTEAYMKALLKTGLEALAVLWGQVGEQTRHQQENGTSLAV